MTPADVLDAAADLIEREGWMGPDYRGGPGECVFTAIGRCGHADHMPVLDAMDLMRARVGGSPIAWNDAPDRTADEVIETLRKVAAEERWTEDAQ